MLSDKSISCIACEVEECAFSTPKLGQDAYPAMVAHLQVGIYHFFKWDYSKYIGWVILTSLP